MNAHRRHDPKPPIPATAVAARTDDGEVGLWLSALFFALVGLALAASADAQVTLYRDSGFRGRAEEFRGPVADLRRTAIGNDRASAVDVAPGCTATLFRDVGFRGPAVEIRGPVADLRRTAIGNDRVSSLDLRCSRGLRRDDPWGEEHHRGGERRRWERDDSRRDHDSGARADWRDRDRRDLREGAVVLFRDVGFRAARLELRGAIAELGRTALGNDRLSSLSVAPGCSAVLYEHDHFRGRSIVVRHDVVDLGRTPIGNDRVSSIEVRCR